MKTFAIAILAGFVTCQQQGLSTNNTSEQSGWESVNISWNKTAIEDFYIDALKFGQLWDNTTRGERNDVCVALADAYKNTAAKLILNFGSTIVPAVRDWTTIARNITTNPQCN